MKKQIETNNLQAEINMYRTVLNKAELQLNFCDKDWVLADSIGVNKKIQKELDKQCKILKTVITYLNGEIEYLNYLDKYNK